MEDSNSYFFIPKEIMTDEFSEYSVETKLLFAILLSTSERAVSVENVADLISKLGAKKINAMYRELQKTRVKSEGKYYD